MIFLSRTRTRKYANMLVKLSLFIFVHRRTGQEFGGGGRTFVCPTSGAAASEVGGSGGILPRENFEM